MAIEVRPIFDLRLDLAEGPQFDEETKVLWFVDITGKSWFEANLNSGVVVARQVQREISAIVRVRPGEFLGLVKEGLAELNLEGGCRILDGFLGPSERMNDAKQDAAGRIWAGSMDVNFTRGRGKLFRFDENRNRTTILNNLSLPNGMGWSSDNETFYFIDSLNYVVWAFDYNLQRGEISNQREFYRFLPDEGIPDGMCVDTEGNLLIAMWGGGAIVVLSPEGKFIRSIELPVSKPTSCILTGVKGLELIVTTSSQGIDLSTEPLGGRLLSVTELNL